MRFYERALCHMQVNHGGGNIRMAQQFLEGNNIQALFQQVGGIAVAERMKINLFGDGGFFLDFRASPTKGL